LFRLAELDFFQERFQDALVKLKSSTANAVSDATNDALGLQIFIQENLAPSDAALKEFAKAELLHRQDKLSEALERFEAILKAYKGTDIIDETLINIGDIFTQMNRYTDAIATYERLITEFPESISRDRTMMKEARVYELGLKNIPKAIETYLRFLEQFPNSIYISEARKRVRALRGDTI
jgi:tetratricopeptide (TPR) repeat protein